MSRSTDRGAAARERRMRLIAKTFSKDAFLHARCRDELLQRLQPVQLTPARILDLGGGTGWLSRALVDRYPKASVVLVDSSPAMLAGAARARGWWRRFDRIRADAGRLPFATASVDLIVANQLLPYAADPAALFAEWRRVLRPRGYLCFSTLGAETLRELKAVFAGIDSVPHVYEFPDFHDVGDWLHRAGFVAPVLDADRVTVTYAGMDDLMRDLRAGGAGTHRDGRATLTGSRRWRAAAAAFAAGRDADGRIPVTAELVYGQAWAPDAEASAPVAPAEVVVPLARLRRRRTE